MNAALDDDPEWEQLSDEEHRLLRELARELGIVFTPDDEEDELTYE